MKYFPKLSRDCDRTLNGLILRTAGFWRVFFIDSRNRSCNMTTEMKVVHSKVVFKLFSSCFQVVFKLFSSIIINSLLVNDGLNSVI